MRPNSVVILVFALVMGAIAAFLARNWLERHSQGATATSLGTIVVAAKPLPFGLSISDDNVTEIPWAASARPDGAFATKDELLRDGRRVVLSPLETNEPVLRTKITAPDNAVRCPRSCRRARERLLCASMTFEASPASFCLVISSTSF